MAQLELLLTRPPVPNDSLESLGGLEELRRTVLLDGIPAKSDGMSELRIYVWLILLNAPPLRTSIYLDLVGQGASPAYSKIRDDTFRTLTSDPLFRRRVSENSLTRVLNAASWRLLDAAEGRANGWRSPPPQSLPSEPQSATSPFLGPAPASDVGYVQGMNVLAAPFLYAARSEVEAFAAFDRCITAELPGYVRTSMDGVHRGLALVDRMLDIVDPKLASYLATGGMKAEIYAFASVLTLCACTPPLPEVLLLWDFLFAYGVHLNLLCIVSQVVLQRDALLASSKFVNHRLKSLDTLLTAVYSPKPDFKPLNARDVINFTVNFARKIPDDVYQEMLQHAK